MSGLSLNIKHIFLSFAQNFFKDSPIQSTYTWDADPTVTDIIIADKYAVDIGVSVKRPSIILSRGSFGWTNSFRNEGITTGNFALERNVPFGSADWERNKSFTDLLGGSITFNVVARHGVQAESIADQLFYALTGYRDLLKKKGIHKIQDLSMSDERIVKQSSEIDLAAIAVSLRFLGQKTVVLGEKQYNVRVFIDGSELFEGVDYRIPPDGTTIEFKDGPAEDCEITVNYIDAVTLNQVVGAIPVESPDGVRTLFSLPASGKIYGFYEIVDSVEITDTDTGYWTTVDGA